MQSGSCSGYLPARAAARLANRREFLVATTALGIAGCAAAGPAAMGAEADAKAPAKEEGKKPAAAESEVSAPEDLMREHGVLRRLLLIYEEALRRLRGEEAVSLAVFPRTATLVRKFVEDYHEKLEENFIFPEFEKRRQLVPLVKVLREQHAAGRAATDLMLRSIANKRFVSAEARQEFTRTCGTFIRMYRAHAAREDTVLFPALHKILSAAEMDALGDQFEKEEDRLFGDEGFAKTVDQVAAIEKQLGIYDLAQFTPKTASAR